MELLQINKLSFKYETQKEWFLENIDFSLNEGEVILLTGPTGCGKSTLIYCINGLIPRVLPGVFSEDFNIILQNREINEIELNEISTKIGIVFQNPETQLFGLTVEEDVAFGPENLGIPQPIIKKRIKSALESIDILNLKKKFVHTLSQGQKQRLAISGILAMEPKILIFDEPTSDLDPKSTTKVLDIIKKLSKTEKKGIIIIEHKLENIIDVVNKIIVMDKGKIIFKGEPKEIYKKENYEKICQIGVNIPYNISNINHEISDNLHFKKPKNLENFIFKSMYDQEDMEKDVITISDLNYSYQKFNPVLKNINLKIKRNEFIALLGENGSGKSTLVKCLNGLLKPTSGKVIINGLNTSKEKISKLSKKIGYLFQNPNHQIIKPTVYEEIEFGLKNFKYKKAERNKKITQILEFFNLEDYKNRPIYRLSRGQRQIIALASILVLEPKTLILDEPTTGMDYKNRLKICRIAEFLNRMGMVIILITHDMELAYKFAKRVLLLNDGEIVKDGTPNDVFQDKEFLIKIGLDQPNSFNI